LYVQAAAAGLTLFDLPPSKVQKDLLEWQPLLDWVEQDR
jgi:chromosome partitioning protein